MKHICLVFLLLLGTGMLGLWLSYIAAAAAGARIGDALHQLITLIADDYSSGYVQLPLNRSGPLGVHDL